MFSSISYALDNVLIDCGDMWEGCYNVSVILLTHAHFDHIYGLNELMKISPSAKVYTNEVGRNMLIDARRNLSVYNETPFVFEHAENIVTVSDTDEINLGNGVSAKAIFTPGHNPSCITWVVDNMVFSGDSLIPGIKTVTNLPMSNRELAVKSEELIKQLAIARNIYPGHSTA